MNTIRISSHDVIDLSSWTMAASSQPIRNNQSRLGHTRFPALQTCNVYLLYALIGSSWYISSLWLVIIITLFTLIGHCKNALFVWSQHLLQPFAWLFNHICLNVFHRHKFRRNNKKSFSFITWMIKPGLLWLSNPLVQSSRTLPQLFQSCKLLVCFLYLWWVIRHLTSVTYM